MKKLFILMIAMTTAGCGSYTPPSIDPVLRRALFVECMELAAKTSKVGHYNDNAEVVSECNAHSQYMAASYSLARRGDER